MIKKWEAQEMTMSYHQFTVYQKGGKPPVMDWTDEDIKRGYTTGEHAVSFEGSRKHGIFSRSPFECPKTGALLQQARHRSFRSAL